MLPNDNEIGSNFYDVIQSGLLNAFDSYLITFEYCNSNDPSMLHLWHFFFNQTGKENCSQKHQNLVN